MFKKLFKKKKSSNSNSTLDAHQNILNAEHSVSKIIADVENKIKEQIEIMRANKDTNKRLALMAARRKKAFEQRLEELYGFQASLDNQRNQLENSKANAQIFNVLKESVITVKQISKKIDIDQVGDLAEDIAETNDTYREMVTALSAVGGVEVYDDDDLLQELENLEPVQSVPTPAVAAPSESVAIKTAPIDIPMPVIDIPTVPSASNIKENSNANNEQPIKVDSSLFEVDIKDLVNWPN